MPANELEFRSGRTRPALIATIGSLALLAAVMARPGWIIGVPLLTAIALACVVELRRKGLWQAIRLENGGNLSLRAASSATLLTGRAEPRFISAFYVSVRLVAPDQTRAFVGVFRDELDSAAYRRLLARLRLGDV